MPSTVAPKVLMTGVSGFLGPHCARSLLKRGFEVVGVSRTPPAELPPGLQWRPVDLHDADAVRKAVRETRATHLLHAAWHNGGGNVDYNSFEHTRWPAVSMMLIREFADAGGERVVSLGSCSEYDWSDGVCRAGETQLLPDSYYGACKLSLFLMLRAFARTSGFSFSWPRIFFTYGPGEDERRLVASVVRALLAHQPVDCTHGLQRRDYLHIQDVAEAIVALLLSDYAGAVDIASGRAIAVRDLITEISRQLNGEGLVRLGARPSPPQDVPLIVGDSGLLHEITSWAPSFTLQTGIADTIRAIAMSMGVSI